MKRNFHLFSIFLLISAGSIILIFFSFTNKQVSKSAKIDPQVQFYSKLPYDTPLNAVKWTNGLWYDRMNKLRKVYIPGVLDGSFMSVTNGSTYHNFLRVAKMETGSAIGSEWSDGDCFFLLDAVSRVYAYNPDTYLKGKLDYWISILEKIQQPDGLIDSWTTLGKSGSAFQYNFGHLYKTAITHQKATSENTLLSKADKYCNYYSGSTQMLTHQVAYAYGLRYIKTGETAYLDKLKSYYSSSKTSSGFGPPFRVTEEIYGHNTMSFHELNGAMLLYNLTGEPALLDALNRLLQNMIAKKSYITGAVGSLNTGQRPVMTVNNKTYQSVLIEEAFGVAYDLPLDKAYCESCGQCLHMESLYNMFRLTGNQLYMDAAERMLYNTTLGTVSLDQANFFYCNPQRQGADSWRKPASGPNEQWTQSLYSWNRDYLCNSACCRPKVLRAIAMTAEMAYNVNDQGLWVNLYGSNKVNIKLPLGDSLTCFQTSNYPWDGKIKLEIEKSYLNDPFGIFFRIPEWVESSVTVTVNGQDLTEVAYPGAYYQVNRKWSAGDRIEMEFPMPVKMMAADGRIAETRGLAAIMRGPIVYCLENQDIPYGKNIELYHFSGGSKFNPVSSTELGGIIKLNGSMVYTPQFQNFETYDTGSKIVEGKGTYQKITLPEHVISESGDQIVPVSLIPFYARLNRSGKYFKTWMPVYNNYKSVGINRVKNQEDIQLFPNPASSHLFITLKNSNELPVIRIYSSEGKLIQVVNTVSLKAAIPVNKLSSGVYYVEARLKNNQIIRKSFVKN